MSQDSNGLIKYILAAVVIILVLVFMSYMKINAITQTGSNQLATAIMDNISPQTVFAAPTGPVIPGTDMTPDELRQYFSVNITINVFPTFIQCVVYEFYMLPMFQEMPDSTVTGYVNMMELQGYDVPNKGPSIPPSSPC